MPIGLVGTLTAIGSYQKMADIDRSDSALYAYGASLIGQGQQLYRDFWDHKPPGVYLIDAMAFRIAGGPSWAAVVTADMLATLLSVLACAVLVWRVTRAALPTASTAVLAAFYLNLADLHEGGGLAESHMIAFSAGAALMLVTSASGRRNGTWLAISGGLAGLAILCKPTAGTVAVAAIVSLLAYGLWARQYRRGLGQIAAWTAGLTVPLILAGLHFAAQGTLGAMLDATLFYNISYVERGWGLRKFVELHHHHNLLLLAGMVLAVAGVYVCWRGRPRAGVSPSGRGHPRVRRRRSPGDCASDSAGLECGTRQRSPASADPEPAHSGEAFDPSPHHPATPGTWRLFLPLWLVLEWLGAYAGNFDNGQYLLAFVLPLSCLGGLGAARWVQMVQEEGPARARTAAMAYLLLAGILAWLPVRDQWRRTVLLARAAPSPGLDQVLAGQHIRATSDPADRIWVWGYAPQVYFAADRPVGSRYAFDGVFLNSRRVLTGEFRKMLSDLDCSAPIYIVDAGTTGWFAIGLEDPLPQGLPAQIAAYRKQLEQLQCWVAEHYEPETRLGELILYRRKAEDPVLAGEPAGQQPGFPPARRLDRSDPARYR